MSTPDHGEQDTPVLAPSGGEPDLPLEAVDADVVEQAADAGPPSRSAAPELPLEADAVDAAEQAAVVELDEDEHR